MKRILPTAWPELLVPNDRYDYFAEWQRHPFRPDASGYDPVNAWWLMEAAFLAYGDEALVRARLDAAGLTAAGCAVRSFAANSTAGFVVRHPQWLLLAFRGTEIDNAWGAVMDTATDLTVLPIRHHSGGLVHKGFYDALNAVWQPVVTYIEECAKAATIQPRLWITGHSLGAALATLAAAAVVEAENCPPVQGVYTYGSPRVGDPDFFAYYRDAELDARTHRIVNNQDVVARLPPESAYYTHVGQLRFFDAGGRLRHAAPLPDLVGEWDLPRASKTLIERLRAVRSLEHAVNLILPPWLVDHAPILYAGHLWNQLDEEADTAHKP